MRSDWVPARVRALIAGERKLATGIVGVSALKVGAVLAGFATTLLLAAILQPAGLGAYAYAFSLAQLLTLPILQGLPTLVLREVAKVPAAARFAQARKLLRLSDRMVAGVAAICASALLGWWLWPQGRDPGLLEVAAIMLPLVSVATLVRGSVARADGHAVHGQIPDMLLRPAMFVLLTPLLWLLPGADAGVAMVLHVAAAVCALLLSVRLLPKQSGDVPAGASMGMRASLLALLPLSTVAGMQLVNSQIDLVLLGALSDKESVGIYRVATSLALQVSFMLTIVNAVLAPRFASLYREGDIRGLRRMNRIGAAVAFAFGLCVVSGYFLIGEWLIGKTVGGEYLPGFLPMLILSSAHLVSLWAGTTNVLLNMIGREKDVLRAAAIAACTNVGLNLVLIPSYGIVGAAIGSGTSLLVWRGVLSWSLARRLREADK